MSDKVFRHTPHRAADALKIIVGNKTNATIRDLEETEEDIEELEGIITSIDKDKMTGDGWKVKTKKGTFDCSCASNMYDLPETEEFGGIYYPKKKVKVKITKNPVLRTNVITEITSLGKNETKIDLSKWKHGDKATTVIAKPKSAISISDAKISFNYNNTNEILLTDEEAKFEGKKTNIKTKNFNAKSKDIEFTFDGFNFNYVPSESTEYEMLNKKYKKSESTEYDDEYDDEYSYKYNINKNNIEEVANAIKINGQPLNEFIDTLNRKVDEEKYQLQKIQNNELGIDIQKSDNVGELKLDLENFNFYYKDTDGKKERIIADLKDPIFYPGEKQINPIFTGNSMNALYIYPNGLVTVRLRGDNKYIDEILSKITWITSEYINKNMLTVTIKQMCDCCDTTKGGTITYFNYCPDCHMWNVLYDDGKQIKCNGGCNNIWCQGCGHVKKANCDNKEYDLKKYETRWTVSAIGTYCDYCKDEILQGKMREYANYCPECHRWGYLTLETETYNDTERHFFRCTHPECREKFCVNCSIQQKQGFIKNFLKDNVYYDVFNETFRKIIHIRDD